MSQLPNMQEEFAGMMKAAGLEQCPDRQRLAMCQAFYGGAVIVARARGDEEMIGHLRLAAMADGALVDVGSKRYYGVG